MIDSDEIYQFFQEENISTTEGDILLTWTVSPHFPYFEGHFPDNPILPGVALLDLLQVLLKRQFHTLKSVKFTEPIRPLDILTIHAQKLEEKKEKEEESGWTIQFSNQLGRSVCKAIVFCTRP